jgi:hypothetical protein
MSAGICETSPSPMESSVKRCNDSVTVMPFACDADGEAAENVDQRDQDGRDGIAAHELARPVHRAVEVRFLFHLAAAGAGLFFIDDAGAEFGINRHLFAGHGIQGEPRRDFRDAARALGDDDEIDQDEDQEDDEPDDIIAAHDEVAERFDDVARVTIQQNQARGGDVEREPEQRDTQQQRRKTREVRGVFEIQDHQQDQQGDRDADREEQIERHRRHRDDQQQHRAEQPEDEPEIALAQIFGEAAGFASARDWVRVGAAMT